MPHIHTLSLVTTERESEPKSVCDFMVDGKMLSSQIDPEEFISPFGWGCPDYQKVTIKLVYARECL